MQPLNVCLFCLWVRWCVRYRCVMSSIAHFNFTVRVCAGIVEQLMEQLDRAYQAAARMREAHRISDRPTREQTLRDLRDIAHLAELHDLLPDQAVLIAGSAQLDSFVEEGRYERFRCEDRTRRVCTALLQLWQVMNACIAMIRREKPVPRPESLDSAGVSIFFGKPHKRELASYLDAFLHAS